MKQSSIETCLITALGRSRRINLNVRLEFHDPDYIYISAIIRSKDVQKPTIITDKQGSIEFIELELARRGIDIRKLDSSEMPSLPVHIPSLHKLLTHADSSRPSSAHSDKSINSRKQTFLRDAWLFNTVVGSSDASTVQRLAREAYPATRKLRSLKSSQPKELKTVKSNADSPGREDAANNPVMAKYLADVTGLFYCSLRITTLKYLCGRGTLE